MRTSINLILNILFLFGFVIQVRSQNEERSVFSLADAREYAVKNNYNIKNANTDIKLSEKKVWETTSIGLPQINTQVNYQNFIDLPTSVVPAEAFGGPAGEILELQFGTEQNAALSLSATQLLFDGTYIVGLQAAKTFVQFSKDQLRKTEIEVKDAVTRAYYLVLSAEENKNILKQSSNNLKKTLFETEQLYLNGFLEEQDVDQLRLVVSNTNNSINRSERQTEQAYMWLKLQMGMDAETTIQLSDSLETVLANTNSESLLNSSFELNSHIDFQLISTQEALTQLIVKKEKYTRLPSVGSFFSYSRNAFRNDFSFFGDGKWYPTTVWGLSIKIPVFDGFGQSARIEQAKLELEKVRNQKMQLSQNLRLIAITSKNEFNSAYERFKTEKENLELAEKIKNKSLIKYKEGLASSLDLIQTENQYLTTQGNYIQSIIQLLNAKADLDKVLNNY